MSSRRSSAKVNLLPAGFILLFLLLLFATNPDQVKFTGCIQSEIKNSGNEGWEGLLIDLFSGPVADLVSVNATRNNYYLFSIYRFELGDLKLSYLGALNGFYKISDSRETKRE